MNENTQKLKEFILNNDPGYYSEEFLELLDKKKLEEIRARIEKIIVWKDELKKKFDKKI